MESTKINSIEDLYRRLLPALSAKVATLKRHNIKHIKEKDIWEYLTKFYWREANKLSLNDVVNDILSTPNEELEAYTNRKNQTEEAPSSPGGLL